MKGAIFVEQKCFVPRAETCLGYAAQLRGIDCIQRPQGMAYEFITLKNLEKWPVREKSCVLGARSLIT